MRLTGSRPAERVKNRIASNDPSPGTSHGAGKRLLFLNEFAHVLGPGNALDKLLTPTEATNCQCAVVEEAASNRKLDQDGFYGGQ
jgi:hypothetical protein